MDSFEKEINTTFLKLNIPFVDYGITSSDYISLEGIFRNPEFPNLSQNRNQLFVFFLRSTLKMDTIYF